MNQPPPPPGGFYPPVDPYGFQPQYPGGWAATAAPPPAGRGDRLGPRASRRPEPRQGIALAGAGAALVLVGALVWSVGYYAAGLHLALDADGLGGGASRHVLGGVLFLLVTVAGYAAAILRQRGPLATAGAVAAAFGVPLAVLFFTLDVGDVLRGQSPFDLDAVCILSVLVWLADYFLVPGLRGRAIFLGAAAILLAWYVALKAAGIGSIARIGTAAVGGSGTSSAAIAAVGLVFGLAYYLLAALLDRRGWSGAAVAFVVAGFDATASGIAAGAGDLRAGGTGLLLVVLATALTWYGGRYGRRFTTWIWAAAGVVGIVLLLAAVLGSAQYTAVGVALILVGVAVVVAAALVGTREAPDVEDGPAAGGPTRVEPWPM